MLIARAKQAVMIIEIGHIALILAFLTAILQAVLPLWGAQRGNVRFMVTGDKAAKAQFVLIAIAFVCLTYAFIKSDFSVQLVEINSHTDKPLIYKISGVWGNHEGSMLLWVLILSLFGALVPVFGKSLPSGLKARALSIQAMIAVGFLGFVLFTSNPFLRNETPPLNGQGLNPLLQDPGLAFHPPFLYLGYVGFSMSFSFALAALIEGRVDAIWARWLRPWVLIAWSFLTIGIVMGSIWAYYELGWGGWWMWDPVENVSFMPWLTGTALLHSILVLSRRHAMPSWTVLLAITTFSLSLVGTFIVRSGVLVSVHSFAVDPKRGIFILALLGIATGGGLLLYALRGHRLKGGPSFGMVSKEGGLLLNNLLLCVAAFTVFLGTFYPLLIEVFSDEKISVGAPFFERTFAPVMVVLIVFMGIGPLLKWRQDNVKSLIRFFVFGAVIFAVIVLLTLLFGKSVLGALAIALAVWLGFSTLYSMAKKTRFGKTGFLTRLKAQPANVWGFFLAHLGMAICVVGISAMSVWEMDSAKVLKIGEEMKLGGYEFVLDNVSEARGDNYQALAAKIMVKKNDKEIAHLNTQKRYYPIRKMVTTEAGINVGIFRNLYVGLGDGDSEKGFVIRAYIHPFVNWIWFGALLMALAGFVSLIPTRGVKS